MDGFILGAILIEGITDMLGLRLLLAEGAWLVDGEGDSSDPAAPLKGELEGNSVRILVGKVEGITEIEGISLGFWLNVGTWEVDGDMEGIVEVEGFSDGNVDNEGIPLGFWLVVGTWLIDGKVDGVWEAFSDGLVDNEGISLGFWLMVGALVIEGATLMEGKIDGLREIDGFCVGSSSIFWNFIVGESDIVGWTEGARLIEGLAESTCSSTGKFWKV